MRFAFGTAAGLLIALAACTPQELTFEPEPAEGGAGPGGDGGQGGAAGGGGRGDGGDGGCTGSACGGDGGQGGLASCPDAGECNACIECSQDSTCLAEQSACDQDTDCVAFSACLLACPPEDMNCFFTCAAQHPTGAELWGNAVNCILCECSGHGFAMPCDQDPATFCGG